MRIDTIWQLWNAWDVTKPENEKCWKRRVELTNPIQHIHIPIYEYVQWNIYEATVQQLRTLHILTVCRKYVCMYVCVYALAALHSAFAICSWCNAIFTNLKIQKRTQASCIFVWLHKCSCSECIYNIYECWWYSITCRFFSTII